MPINLVNLWVCTYIQCIYTYEDVTRLKKKKPTEIDHDFKRTLKVEALSCLNMNTRKASRIFNRYFDTALKEAGLTSGQYSILVALAIYQQVNNKQLASLLELDRTTLTRNLRPLEQNQLVVFSTGDDGRAKLISLTPRGLKTLTMAHKIWQQAHQALVSELGEPQWRDMIRKLHHINHRVSHQLTGI